MLPVYVISLKHQSVRRERIAKRLDSLGVTYTIFTAIDGATLDLSHYVDRLDDKAVVNRRGYGLTRNEIGCFLSHYTLWESIIADGVPHAVILEDDAILEDDFLDVISVLPTIGWRWDVVRLSATMQCKISRVLCPIGQGRVLARYGNLVDGTVAYSISLRGAKILREHCYVLQVPIDVMYQEWWKLDLHFLTIHPPVASFSAMDSIIDPPRRKAREHFETKWHLLARARILLVKRINTLHRNIWNMLNPPEKL